jgi:uncharacterized membrane protein YdbT with pleckstrin-like domain
MGYIEENLISGETILYRTRLHWVVMTGPIIAAVILAIPGLVFLIGSITTLREKDVSSIGMGGIGILFVLGAAAIVGWGIWHRSSTEMAVTNKRVLVKAGRVSRNTSEMMLGKIESVAVNQSVLGRMLGFGTITVRGTGGTPEPFSKIAHPLEFRRQVQQELDKLQSRSAAAGV